MNEMLFRGNLKNKRSQTFEIFKKLQQLTRCRSLRPKLLYPLRSIGCEQPTLTHVADFQDSQERVINQPGPGLSVGRAVRFSHPRYEVQPPPAEYQVEQIIGCRIARHHSADVIDQLTIRHLVPIRSQVHFSYFQNRLFGL